ncbi:MAG: thiamine phosphate synthase [Bacillota bacterium]|nr:thiamine phosphate synthase [Bacillota bacterium]
MKNNVDYSLYLCTDRNLMSTDTIEESVELAIKGGCTVVQLREKDCTSLEFYQLALRVKEITERYNVPLIINDRVDIALAVNADGVHVGQSDLPAFVVRKIIGNDKILGVSASSYEEALKAQKDNADYIGVGAMYSTLTKTDAKTVSIDELKKIRKAINIPIVVIGGINKDTISNFKGMGIDGIAVVSAVVAQKDITCAARELLTVFKEQT